MEFTSGGARSVKEAHWYADIGIDRITIAVAQQPFPTCAKNCFGSAMK
jgi:phosphoribosylformimino-5-aminoimidazole carboxamide ribonucleotide (ProFAR) isomerase